MSIADKTGQTESITEVWRALRLFTNRRRLIRLFVNRLNEDPNEEKVICFYGDGGNGKSLLLKYLREYCTKRFASDNWSYLKTLDNDDFMNQVKDADVKSLPFSALDFGLKTTSDDRPQEAFYGLLMMRRQLATHKFKFPLFDFACVWYLHKTNQLSKERLKTLFPAEEVDFLTGIIDAASSSAYGAIAKSVVNVFFKRGQTQFTLWWQKRGIKEEELEKITLMDAETDLMNRLPEFFAKDLNSFMSQAEAPPRVILFFDTHESFWGSQKDMPSATFFKQDEWLRCLICNLEFSKGIVAVMAGRERPRWAEAANQIVPAEYLDAHLVGHLSRQDANEFLQKAQVEDEAFRQSLIDYAEVENDEIHPLYLGLCVDVILAAERAGICLTLEDFGKQPQTLNKERELVERLLKYVEADVRDAVVALSACRAFNKEIFIELGKALNFHSTDAAFETLQSFSFVWQAERKGEGWYRIHQLLRELFAEQEAEKQRNAHQSLEKFYRKKAETDEAAIAEAIYHFNRLDQEKSIEEWVEVFNKNLRLSGHDFCRILLEVRRELEINNDFFIGYISQTEGDFFLRLANYNEALQEFNESIAGYDKFLKDSPNHVKAHNNKGIVLRSLGDLQAELTQTNEATKSYGQAVESFNQALKLAPNYVYAHNNKGIVLQSLGDLQARLAQTAEATKSYEQAIESFNQALKLAPNDVEAHNNKGNVLRSLGDLQARLAQTAEATKSYEQGVESFNQALKLAPNYVYAHNNKGIVLQSLGDLQARLAQTAEATKSYEQAIESFNQALQLAPNDVYAHNNKGNVLASLGDLQARLAQTNEAAESYGQAVESFNQALKLAPNDVYAHNNKGNVLRSLGDLQAELAQTAEATKSYEQAIESFNQALKLAPNYVYAYNNKGIVLRSLGDLQARLAQTAEATKSYEQAVESLNQALKLSPNDIYAHNNKGILMLNYGVFYFNSERQKDGCEMFKAAAIEFGLSLKIAPNDLQIQNLLQTTKQLIEEYCQDK